MRENHGIGVAGPEILDDLLDGDDRALGRQNRLLLHARDAFQQHVALPVGSERMDDGDIRADRRDGRQHFPGIGAGDGLDSRVHLRQIRADIAAQHREGEVGGPGLIGIRHRGMAVFGELEPVRPVVLHRVAHAVQGADPRVAAPGEDEPFRATHADHLIVENVRRHADQSQSAPLLPDDLMASRIGNEVREALHCDRIAVPHMGGDGFLQ